jgi:Mg-chelatase subunit ChlD
LEFAKKRRLNFPNDWLSVITFESESKIICPPIRLGDNPEQQVLKRSLSKIRSGGGTRLDYGLMLTRKCLHRLGNRIKSNGANQIRNLILTDGHSAGNPEKTAILLKSEGVIIEIIGIGGSPAEVNEKLLKRCASVENGKLLYRFIGDGNSEALVEHFGRLALG